MTDRPKKRGAPIVVLTIAAIVLLVAWWLTRSSTATVTPQSVPVPTAASPASTAQVAPSTASSAATPNAYRAVAPDARAGLPPSGATPRDAGNVPQAISVVIDAPLQALHGSAFEVTVGAMRAENVQSAKFVLTYDTNALEVLDSIDANGTSLPIMPRGDGTVELEFDRALGAARWPAVRFLVRVTEPRAIQLSVVADLWDAAGNALPSEASSPMTIMLWP